MRTHALLLILVTYVLAETNISSLLDAIPECALKCVVKGPEQVGCDVLDMECQCKKLEDITAIVAPCMVHANCTLDEIMQTGISVYTLCESEFNMTQNITEGGAVGDSGDKPGAATRLYGAGWAVLGASVVAAVTTL